ncbi:MAG: hypothetical protein ABH870_02610 [bacterium]
MKATSLEQALNNFTVAELIFTTDAPPTRSREFYIDRDKNPYNRLKTFLRTSNTFDKILFTGHMGCGKSTELNRLAADPDITQRFFVVKYSIFDVLDILDINYIDVLVSMGAQVFMEAVRSNLKIPPELLESLEKWKKNIVERMNMDEKISGMELSGFFLNLTAKIKMEHTTREIIRDIVGKKVSEFISLINQLIDKIRLSLPPDKNLLIIIDDLEKIPDINKAKTLYYDSGIVLTKPNCKIIYTVPIALHYSVEFRQIAGNFGTTYFFPNIRLHHRDGSEDENGFDTMKKFVTNRMEQCLIEDEALKETIAFSGGIVRELCRIMRNSCIDALSEGKNIITKDIVRASVAEIRNEFGRMLTDQHCQALIEIAKTKMVGSDKVSVELLHSLSALEYQNDERWCDINPIVSKILEQYKKVVTIQV